MAPGLDIARRKVDVGTTVWAVGEHMDALVEAGIAAPEVFINRHASSIIDDVTRSKITSVSVNLGGRSFRVAAKEYYPRGGGALVKDVFRPSKARVEFVMAARLLKLGVSVPVPVAAVEVRSLRVLKKAYLFSEEIVGGKSLLELFDAQAFALLGRKQANRIIEKLARTVAHAHGRGLFHGDLNASHLVLRDWEEGEPEVYLLDFENSRIRKTVAESERTRDLGRLERSASYFLSLKERMRFLKCYLDNSNRTSELCGWLQKVRREVERRAR